MKKSIGLDISCYNGTVNGRATFHLATYQLYDRGLAERWNEQTRSTYNGHFNGEIFPAIIDDIPLEDLTEEDFENAIQSIAQNYYKKHQVSISEQYLQHYRYLIRRVVKIAAENGMCEDVFWGSNFAEPEYTEQWSQNNPDMAPFTKTDRSLSEEHELNIYNLLTRDPIQNGQKMGLLLMYGGGFRNEEACGVDFGDVKEIPGHPGNYVIYIYKTTDYTSGDLKVGGKTKNAPRIIPCPDKILAIIKKREAILAEKIKRGEIPCSDVKKLPIVCDGNNYHIRCSSHALTKEGRSILRQAKVNENFVRLVDGELAASQNDDNLFDEVIMRKEVTTYILRRNLGTHLVALGLTDSEIEYIMGHEIEGNDYLRSDFVNPDVLYRIKCKMEYRPYIGTMSKNSEESIHAVPGLKCDFTGSTKVVLQGTGKVHFTTDEPGSMIQIKIRKKKGSQSNATMVYCGNSELPHRDPNVTNIYQDGYRKVKKRGTELDESAP